MTDSDVLYVSVSGSNTSACTPSSPCSILRAVGLADQQRITIKLTPGVYTGGLAITGKRIVIHGFNATLQGAGSVVTIGTAADVRVRGAAITQSASGDAAVLCTGTGSPSSFELDDVTITAQKALHSGGNMGCNVLIRKSAILLQPTADNGSPVAFSGSVVMIDRTLFSGTGSGVSSGMSIANGTQLKMSNSIFANQFSDPVAGSISRTLYSGAVFSFNTFYRSHIVCASSAPSDCSQAFCFDNNIFLDGQVSASPDSVEGSGCKFEYDIAFPQLSSLSGPGNQINLNPRLQNPAGGDFHLQPNSPAIDAGVPGATVSTDFEGAMRPYGGRSDIGAFEYRP